MRELLDSGQVTGVGQDDPDVHHGRLHDHSRDVVGMLLEGTL